MAQAGAQAAPGQPQDPQQEQQSLHGETAARRQAITELLFFASVGDLHRCKKIVTAWALDLKDPRCCDYDRRTPLHLAAAEGCYSVVAWLLSLGVDINAIDRFKRTPTEDAVRGDHGEVASLLAQAGGKVLDKEGELVDLADSPLAGNVRIFNNYDPEWEIDPVCLKLQEKIGEGEFGIVHKALWHGTVVAVKILKETSAVALGDFRTELNVLQKVHHPHTVQFLGAVTKQVPFMIVTEFMAGGSLSDMFRGHKFPNLWRAAQLALDCAKGMAYLHNRTPQAVIHRDLKPANLMLGGPKVYSPFHKNMLLEEIGVMKIADFGLSKSLKINKPKRHPLRPGMASTDPSVADGSVNSSERRDGKSQSQQHGGAGRTTSTSYKLTGETGSYRYMAPEVFRHEQYNNKVDIYSFAMICYQLFEGVPPFWTLDPVEAARAASMEGKRPEWGPVNKRGEQIPAKMKLLVESCWAQDYESRPEFDTIVEQLSAMIKELPPQYTVELPKEQEGCCTVS